PEDLGARKFILEVKPEYGQVVIFRKETFVDGILEDRYDNISSWISLENQTTLQSHSVLLINRSFFTDQSRKVSEDFILTYPGGRSHIDSSRLVSWGSGGNEASLTFEKKVTDGTRKTEYRFTIFVEDYESVKKLIPDLKDLKAGEGWGYGYSHDIETE
ncbi:MAG: hypothetical protein PF450_00465, partial [Bacteroidales bacterium]|nr:hypothetical protein [Bacteroidales bacterium]